MRLKRATLAILTATFFSTRLFAAAISFHDNFEGPTLNPFWKIDDESGSVVFPSMTQAHSGDQSVQLNSTFQTGNKNIYLHHHFESPEYGRASVWLFDTGADLLSSNYQNLQILNTALSRETRIFTQDYDLGATNGGEYYFTRWDGSQFHAKDRTVGWHEFVIDSRPEQTTMSIDGQVFDTHSPGFPFDEVRLTMHGPTWRPAWTTYFDDFEVVQVPEPSSLALGASALVALGWRFWRRRRLFS